MPNDDQRSNDDPYWRNYLTGRTTDARDMMRSMASQDYTRRVTRAYPNLVNRWVYGRSPRRDQRKMDR